MLCFNVMFPKKRRKMSLKSAAILASQMVFNLLDMRRKPWIWRIIIALSNQSLYSRLLKLNECQMAVGTASSSYLRFYESVDSALRV